MSDVSVTILTKDSSKHLKRCLDALRSFSEVVVLDNGSTDDTLDIAGGYQNVRIFRSEFIGFEPLKDLAASHASNDWIFSVDSDEVVTPELERSVIDHGLKDDQVGAVHRLNHFNGRLINACGWQNDITKRLYNRRTTNFGEFRVHESLAPTAGGEVRLAGHLLHFTSDSVQDLNQKAHRYAALYAEQNRGRKRSSSPRAQLAGAGRFIRDHFLLKGVLYGRDGYVIARSNAAGAYYKYLKLAEAAESD